MFSHAIGILIFCKIALHKGRRISILFASIVHLLGNVLILIYYCTYINVIGFLGTSISGLSIYAIPLMIITLIC